jgi:hypothetical protein
MFFWEKILERSSSILRERKENFWESESDRRMQSRSPPKHRHDGTSPLPLGMDWSPPPKKWVYSLLSFYVLSYSWKIIAESRNCGPSDEFDFDFLFLVGSLWVWISRSPTTKFKSWAYRLLVSIEFRNLSSSSSLILIWSDCDSSVLICSVHFRRWYICVNGHWSSSY